MSMGGDVIDAAAGKVIDELIASNKHLRQLVDWQMTKNENLRDALQCVVTYWDEWKDAPDDAYLALSLEEVVYIARSALEGFK